MRTISPVDQRQLAALESMAHLPSAVNFACAFGGLSVFGSTTIPFRTSFLRTRLRAKEQLWPAEHTGTGSLFLSIVRTTVGMKFPRLSGPIMMLSPACITPFLTTPDTTVPTNGTEKQSLTWNSNGDVGSNFPWKGSMLRKVLTYSRPSPVTLETWKTGHIRSLTH